MEETKKRILAYIGRIPTIDQNIEQKKSFYARYNCYVKKTSGRTQQKMLEYLEDDLRKFLQKSYI